MFLNRSNHTFIVDDYDLHIPAAALTQGAYHGRCAAHNGRARGGDRKSVKASSPEERDRPVVQHVA